MRSSAIQRSCVCAVRTFVLRVLCVLFTPTHESNPVIIVPVVDDILYVVCVCVWCVYMCVWCVWVCVCMCVRVCVCVVCNSCQIVLKIEFAAIVLKIELLVSCEKRKRSYIHTNTPHTHTTPHTHHTHAHIAHTHTSHIRTHHSSYGWYSVVTANTHTHITHHTSHI